MSEVGGQDRPSFADYWRRQDEGKPLVFVSQEPQDLTAEQTAQEKAQRRRAQVRKAQLQHRERKATYVKKLELDVTQIRDATEEVERACDVLRRENEEMRELLARVGVVLPSAVESKVPVHRMMLEKRMRGYAEGVAVGAEAVESSFSVEKTVTSAVDEVMDEVCYQIIPSPSSAETGSTQSPTDEDVAIDFILALEHICWDHIHPSDFLAPHSEDSCTETGHVMMATTFCTANAPESLYPLPKETNLPPNGPVGSWETSGLTLQNLRLLASSIVGGEAELTPVQGWFELVERYGADALNEQAMEALKREFMGVVQCPHFGAVMEREAFESVVWRVMGDTPLLQSPGEEEGEM